MPTPKIRCSWPEEETPLIYTNVCNKHSELATTKENDELLAEKCQLRVVGKFSKNLTNGDEKKIVEVTQQNRETQAGFKHTRLDKVNKPSKGRKLGKAKIA